MEQFRNSFISREDREDHIGEVENSDPPNWCNLCYNTGIIRTRYLQKKYIHAIGDVLAFKTKVYIPKYITTKCKCREKK